MVDIIFIQIYRPKNVVPTALWNYRNAMTLPTYKLFLKVFKSVTWQTDRYTDGQIHRRTEVLLFCIGQFFDLKMCNQPCCEIIDMPWPVSDANYFSRFLKAWRDRYTDGHKIGPLIIYRLVSLRLLAPAGGHIYCMLLALWYIFDVVEKFNIKD